MTRNGGGMSYRASFPILDRNESASPHVTLDIPDMWGPSEVWPHIDRRYSAMTMADIDRLADAQDSAKAWQRKRRARMEATS